MGARHLSQRRKNLQGGCSKLLSRGKKGMDDNNKSVLCPQTSQTSPDIYAVDYIMDTFPIVKRKDEQKYGDYRTKRVILEIYDKMAEAMRTGIPYKTILDPPPADPRVAHPLKKV